MQAQFTAADVPPEASRVLSEDGTLCPGAKPSLTDEQVVEALGYMCLSRAFDKKAFSLQRQGRFGTFSPVQGQEASVVGAAMALDPGRDWIVPQYREMPAMVRHGFPLERFVLYFTGNPAGGQVPEGVNVLPIQISLAAQIPQAVGLAWGLMLRGSDAVVVVFFGDGASSEGDFHEACNLAGVVGAPVVFLLQNNGWAISTPTSRQTRAATFAQRAPGYGFPGALVDGNDLLAVHAVVSTAVDLARSGGGPTLVETLTYRMGAHNTADDPTRYADPTAADPWRRRDPIERIEAYLRDRGCWDDERAAALQTDVGRRIDAALVAARAFPPPGPEQVFAHVYARPTPRLAAQRAAAADPEGGTVTRP